MFYGLSWQTLQRDIAFPFQSGIVSILMSSMYDITMYYVKWAAYTDGPVQHMWQTCIRLQTIHQTGTSVLDYLHHHCVIWQTVIIKYDM